MSTSMNPSKTTSSKTLGISPVQMENSADEMVKLLLLLIIERFSLKKGNIKKLYSQLWMYFNTNGITNELCLGVTTKHASWAVHDSLSAEVHSIEQLTVPVALQLSKLAT